MRQRGQRVGESGEGSEVEGFSTNVGVQVESEQRCGDPFAREIERERERVRERLAAVRERAAHDLFEARSVAHLDERRLAPSTTTADDDLRPRKKLPGARR